MHFQLFQQLSRQMIYSHRGFNHQTDPKKLDKMKKSSCVALSNTTKFCSMPNENNYETECLISAIRQHQLRHLQFRNELLKKQIELKQRTQQVKDIQKQVIALRKDKQVLSKYKQKFELQRKNRDDRIYELESCKEELQNRLDSREAPKDRYQTCLRELDELKSNIEDKQDIVKERDLYKYFYDEVRDLITCSEYSAEQVRNSLKSFFTQMSQKLPSDRK